MEKIKGIILERIDAGEQLPAITRELLEEGFSRKDINRALEMYHLKLKKK